MDYADVFAPVVFDAMRAEALKQEQTLVRACRRGEPFVDFPNEFTGGIDRKILPTTLFGRWRKLRKAGYRLRGPK